MNESLIIYILLSVCCFVPAIVLHEVGHGFAAYLLGDPTAKEAGRLTLNPMAHIDWFGTAILPLMLAVMGGPVFGYAKPVPYNPRYFEDPRKGDLIVGLAGPAVNLLLALIAAGVAWLLYPMVMSGGISNEVFYYFYVGFLPMFVLINLYLMFFNLIPIPPLDGSSIFAFILPIKALPAYYRVQQYSFPIFFVLLFFVPYLLNINPISIYLDFVAGNFANLIFPFQIS